MFWGNVESLETRCFLSASTWTINATADPDLGGATVFVQVSDDDPTQLQAVVNDEVVDTRAISDVKQIVINGTSGDDDIEVDLGDATSIKVKIYGNEGDDFITGGDEADTIYGGAGDDTIDGGAGNDLLDGGTGNDDITGDDGNDSMRGGTGDDTLTGDYGNDSLNGGAGNDDLQGSGDNDKLYGKSGDDTLRGGDGTDYLNSGSGVDDVYRDSFDHVCWHKHATFNLDDLPTYTRLTDPNDLKNWWIDRAVDEYRWQLDGWGHIYWLMDAGGIVGSSPGVTNYAADNSGGDTSPPEPIHSTTNTQESGVDEADLVETDGNTLYTIVDNEVVAVDVRDPANPTVVSRTQVDGAVNGMYLDGHNLTVITDNFDLFPLNMRMGIMRPLWWGGGATSSVEVMTYDVTDPTSPTLTSNSQVDGSLVSSRMVDGRLYLVVSNSTIRAPEPEQTGTDDNGNPIYETEAEYRARLASDPTLLGVPQVITTANGQTITQDLVQVPNTFVPQGGNQSWLDSGTMTSVVELDTRGSGVESSASVAGYGSTVYASADAMYLATYDWNNSGTRLLKFQLGKDSVDLVATGGVSGQVLNQFSMSDYNGTFRIATNDEPWFYYGDGEAPTPTSNNVFTLKQDGDRLEQVGALTGIAEGEAIQSARFVGDRGYLVTFHNTDPLFTLDMSDPANPKIDGQLVVPGYSSYLQPLSDTLLFGLGKYADPANGETDWSGVQISLFDVSDQSNPQLVDSQQLNPTPGQDWAFSEAEWDAHAITWIADKNLLALPVNGELELIGVDPTTGFTEEGVVAPQDDTVRRTVRINNDVFAIGDHTITVRSMDDLKTDTASIDTTDPNATSNDNSGGAILTLG